MEKVAREYMEEELLKAKERMNVFGEVKDKSDLKVEDKEAKLN